MQQGGQMYGREDRQTTGRQGGSSRGSRGSTSGSSSGRPSYGRFGGHTDVNRRDQRYGQNTYVGKYGGYTRQNEGNGQFGGRTDPWRSNTQNSGTGYNPYKNHGTQTTKGVMNRLGEICSKIDSAAIAKRECANYTGRQGCQKTCAKYDTKRSTGRNTGRGNTGRFGGRTGSKTGTKSRYTTGTKKQKFQWPSRTGSKTSTKKQHGGIHLPTQGGDFGRNTGTKTNTYGRQTRGQGQNGMFGGRLGQEGNNKQPSRYQLPSSRTSRTQKKAVQERRPVY